MERFQHFIQQAQREYDLIVIDTNPSATLMTMHALAVANFLVAPVMYDKFSLRGIHLVTTLLRKRYDWLSNPLRVRIVPNKIKHPTDHRARARLLTDEQRMREAFPDLSRSFMPLHIRELQIILNENCRHRFIAEQSVPNRQALANLLEDLDNVAGDLLATFVGPLVMKQKSRELLSTLSRENSRTFLVSLWSDLSALTKEEFIAALDGIAAPRPARRRRQPSPPVPKDDRPVTRIAFVLANYP